MQMALPLVIWSPEGTFARGTLLRSAAPLESSSRWWLVPGPASQLHRAGRSELQQCVLTAAPHSGPNSSAETQRCLGFSLLHLGLQAALVVKCNLFCLPLSHEVTAVGDSSICTLISALPSETNPTPGQK